MKLVNQQKLQRIALNHPLNIGFQDFMSLCKKCTEKPYSLLKNDTTLALDNPLCFRNKLLERI